MGSRDGINRRLIKAQTNCLSPQHVKVAGFFSAERHHLNNMRQTQMNKEESEAISLILLEMQMWLPKYDIDSEIFKDLVKAMGILGFELDVVTD